MWPSEPKALGLVSSLQKQTLACDTGCPPCFPSRVISEGRAGDLLLGPKSQLFVPPLYISSIFLGSRWQWEAGNELVCNDWGQRELERQVVFLR